MAKRDFENFASLRDDECALIAREQQNRSMGDYMLYNTFITSQCTQDKKQFEEYMFQNPNLRYKDGFGFLNGCTVDVDSRLRNGAMTTIDKQRSQVCSMVPSLTKAKCECDVLTEKDFDRFIPLPSCLAANIQNPEHIIPKWVNGGASTRQYVMDNQYLEQCGFVNNGSAWVKPSH